MSDDIKAKIAGAKDHLEVFQLLRSFKAPVSVLKIGGSVTGELWIEKSKRVFFASVNGDNDNGMLNMLQLLAARDATYTLDLNVADKKKENVDIKLAALIADQQAVIQSIKDTLWPVIPSESDVMTEAAILPIAPEVLNEVYKRVQERDDAEANETATAAVTEAAAITEAEMLEIFKAQAEAKYAAAKAELEGKTQPETSAEQAEKAEAREKAEAEAKEKAEAEAKEKAEAEAKEKAEAAVSDALEEPVVQDFTPPPDNSSLEIPTLISEESPIGDEDTSTTDQKPSIDEEPSFDDKPVLETTTYSSVASEVESSASPELEEEDASDPMLAKRRANMRALEMWVGEEPEKFYEESETPVKEDDILDHRKAEMDALSAMLAAHVDLQKSAFEDKEPETKDPEAEKRKKEYEALNEYFGEKPETFYEEVSMGAEDPQGVEELRSKVLKAMEVETDPVAFNESDPILLDNTALRPKWEPEPEPEPVVEEPVAETKPEDEYVPPDLEPSPFGEQTSSLNFEEKHKGKLQVDGLQDDLSLLDRAPKRDNKYGFLDKSKLIGKEALPRHVLIAALLVAALMPLIGLYLYHYFNMRAQADFEDEAATKLLAAEAAEEASKANKPQEAFRMPDAPPPRGAPSNNSADTNQLSTTISEGELAQYKWKPPVNPTPPPTQAQLAEASRALSNGENLLTSGRTEEAAAVFADGLVKCPNHPQLRIRAARAYMALRQYQTAKLILTAGMHDALSQDEFNTYFAILQELPRS